MTQVTAPSRLPMLIVVAILLVLLAFALLWPVNEPEVDVSDDPVVSEVSSIAPEQNTRDISE